MVIELSAVQFGLKSYVCFQNQRSTVRLRFEITSMILDSLIATLLDPFWNHTIK